MKSFFFKIIIFLIPIVLFLMSGLIIPATPRASKSLLFAIKQKDSLLKYTQDPRIIFIGGSNLSFGLNSYLIKDSLKLNPINTGVHIEIGLKYMLDNALKFIKKKDIVIIAPEYNHFYSSYDKVSDELLRTIVDVSPENSNLLSFKQCLLISEYIPKFTLTKFKKTEYAGFKESDVYGVNSFNRYGDVDAHWNLENRDFKSVSIDGKYNGKVIDELKKFINVAESKGAIVFLTFPPIDEVSYQNSIEKILKVENALKNNNFKILGSSKKYVLLREKMFDGYYHPNKCGVDERTKILINDFQQYYKNK